MDEAVKKLNDEFDVKLDMIFGEEEVMMKLVNHPAHYAENCSIECIEAMEMVFEPEELIAGCKVNAFKYLWRYKAKNGREDLQKMSWYIKKAYQLYEKYEHVAHEDMAIHDRLLFTLYSFCEDKLTDKKIKKGRHEHKGEEVKDGLS